MLVRILLNHVQWPFKVKHASRNNLLLHYNRWALLDHIFNTAYSHVFNTAYSYVLHTYVFILLSSTLLFYPWNLYLVFLIIMFMIKFEIIYFLVNKGKFLHTLLSYGILYKRLITTTYRCKFLWIWTVDFQGFQFIILKFLPLLLFIFKTILTFRFG